MRGRGVVAGAIVPLAVSLLFAAAPAAASANAFTFTELGSPAPYLPPSFDAGKSLVAADYNGDGHADIAFVNSSGMGMDNCPVDGCVSVLLGHGDGTFSGPVNFDPGGCPYYGTASLAQGDLLGNGREDLVIADGGCAGAGSVTILYGNGDGTFSAPVTISTGVGFSPQAVAVGDFNGDGRPDIAVASAGTEDLSILLNQGGGNFTPAPGSPFPLASGTAGSIIGMSLANLTGHGKVDLVLSIAGVAIGGGAICGAISCVQTVTNKDDGTGNFNSAVAYQVDGAGQIAAADLRGTGRDDVVLPARTGIQVLLNQGSGALGSPTTFTYPGAALPQSLALGDFNGDGKLDAAVADFDAGETVLFEGHGDGTFTYDDTVADPRGEQDTDNVLVAASFTGSCKLDLALGSDNGVIIMRNDNVYTCPVTPSPPPAPAPTPNPSPSPPSVPRPSPLPPTPRRYAGLRHISIDVPLACTATSVRVLVVVTNRQGPQSTVVYLNGHRVATSGRLRFTVGLALKRIAVGGDTWRCAPPRMVAR